MTVQITILGLEQIGTSIGLALASQKDNLFRIGNDISMDTARQSQKLGAIDKIVFNLPSSVEKADIVVLALPFDQIRETIKVIAQDLKSGAVLIDTSGLKVKVAEWAEELLPAERYFVSITPTLNPAYLHETVLGVKSAHADLFRNSVCIVTAPRGTHEDAMKLASDLVALLGAQPFFADPYESDGLTAASHLLPQLMAAALLDSSYDRPGWREGRKVAGRAYALSTAPILHMDDQKPMGQMALLNKENILRVIDGFIASLQTLRGHIESGDEQAVHDFLHQAREGRFAWWVEREKGNWDESTTRKAEIPTAGDRISQMFFGSLLTRRPKPPRQSDQSKEPPKK